MYKKVHFYLGQRTLGRPWGLLEAKNNGLGSLDNFLAK
jgi:hypothetical protein